MLFKYNAVTETNEPKEGVFDAVSMDIAIASLQKRGLIIISISPVGENVGIAKFFAIFEKISNKDIVILARQLSTLFEAKVSALDSFKLLASESENPVLKRVLVEITDDLQSGISISSAMAKHQEAFSPFFVSMVRSGEESGRLTDSFNYLAEYMDRTYELTQKVRNALIYPVFVIVTFFVVMILMFIYVIPKLSEVLTDTGQEVPFYTKITIGISSFFVDYGFFIFILLLIAGFYLYRYVQTPEGMEIWSKYKMGIPYVGNLYKMFYLSRIADNMNTLITSGVTMVRSIEITADVVGSDTYKTVLENASKQIRAGNSFSKTLEQSPEVPRILIQMIRIGEETGNLGSVLKTMSAFYKREVDNAVDSLVGLIEPAIIVVMGLGVAILLMSILNPIYSITTSI